MLLIKGFELVFGDTLLCFFCYLAYQAKENGLDYQQGKNEC